MNSVVPPAHKDRRPGYGCAATSGAPGSVPARYRDRLASVILLAGQVAPTPLTAGIGRSVLDLPLDDGCSVFDAWCDEMSRLATALGREALEARVVLGQAGHMPTVPADGPPGVALRVERDPREFRGTAGVVKDLTADQDPDDFVLVGSAHQLQLEPLSEVYAALASEDASITLLSHRDGTPGGMTLIRCGSLAGVPDVGFVDLKEQALPVIGTDDTVAVVQPPVPSALPIRTLADYVRALRAYHLAKRGESAVEDPYAERWQPAFRLVEDGAVVAPGARLQDAVVLSGAVVEEETVVVRSVVGPGGVVGRRERVIGKIVEGRSRVAT